jgi:Soluble NSF attachment protein, SNAP
VNFHSGTVFTTYVRLQIYVKELNDVKRGCESYDQAAEWYDQEDSKA